MITDYDKENIESIIRGEGTWFTAHLLRLCDKADPENLAKLGKVFPDVVEAYQAWRDSKPLRRPRCPTCAQETIPVATRINEGGPTRLFQCNNLDCRDRLIYDSEGQRA